MSANGPPVSHSPVYSHQPAPENLGICPDANILVVDDEANIRFFLEEMLTHDGYRVVTASDGETALKYASREEFDLVLVDIQMPKVNGMEVLIRLRETRPNTVVIILTAHATLETAIEALRQGAHDYQLKPCTADDLRSSVKSGLLKRSAMLREKTKLKVVSDVTHDIRNLVANIGLYADLLETDTAEKSPAYLSVIRDQIHQLVDLTQNMFNRPHLEAERADESFIAVNLNSLAWQVVAAHKPRSNQMGLDLAFNPEKDLPLVRANPLQLGRVLNNLVTNAINYTFRGQVNVSTCLSPDHTKVGIGVQDSGMGIDEAEMPYLFESSFRGSRAMSVNVPGSGLGLAIVKDIVKMHNGEIEVHSKVDEGSVFRVWLPLK